MQLDERMVALAAAITIDYDYFSRHSAHGGGLLSPFIHPPIIPYPVPVGEGAAAEGAAAAAEGAGESGAEGAAGEAVDAGSSGGGGWFGREGGGGGSEAADAPLEVGSGVGRVLARRAAELPEPSACLCARVTYPGTAIPPG